MTLETWILFAAVATVVAISPGPGLLFTVSTALRFGPAATVATALATAAGMMVLGVAAALGVSAVIAASAWAFMALKLFGAGYLVFLGVKLWRDRGAFAVETQRSVAPPPTARLIRQALLIALTNPKAVVLLAALLPPFISAGSPAAPQALTLSIAYAVICALCHLAVGQAAGALRRVLTTERRAAAVRRLVGASFLGFGVALAGSARP